MSIMLLDRFWSKVTEDAESGCWLWTGRTVPDGYGSFWFQGRRYRAHRLSYEALVDSIPDDLVTDHLCRRRNCVNPFHLDLVPSAENTRRGNAGRNGDTCRQGLHPWPESIKPATPGRRQGCLPCYFANQQRKYARARERRRVAREMARLTLAAPTDDDGAERGAR